MKTNIISLTDDTIRFVVSGIDTAFANTLRRTMSTEVPIMTIEDIFYFDNSSLVPDEILAHRLGLTPLTTDLDTYILPEECDCEAELGCPKCRAVLTMDVEAKEDDTVVVYSGDLIPDDPNTAPASKRIPLAKLAPGQAIRFEAYAQLGQGKTHVKWCPTSMCVYQNVSVIPIVDKEKVEECVASCGDAAVIEGDNLKIIDIQKFEASSICRDLVSRDAVMASMVDDEFLFTVESNGALSPERIVTEAVKILKKRVAAMSAKVEADDIHDEISDFEIPEVDDGKLNTVESGEPDVAEDGDVVSGE